MALIAGVYGVGFESLRPDHPAKKGKNPAVLF
jgi:hypothetical protein